MNPIPLGPMTRATETVWEFASIPNAIVFQFLFLLSAFCGIHSLLLLSFRLSHSLIQSHTHTHTEIHTQGAKIVTIMERRFTLGISVSSSETGSVEEDRLSGPFQVSP